jgi:hypothetical protein
MELELLAVTHGHPIRYPQIAARATFYSRGRWRVWVREWILACRYEYLEYLSAWILPVAIFMFEVLFVTYFEEAEIYPYSASPSHHLSLAWP